MPARVPAARLEAMTTMTDAPTPPPAPAPPAPSVRRLRRSTSDRVAVGVAGGLGEYFGVDPVLFRVLFAVTSFFGGAGVIGYFVAWILIPDSSTEVAPLDRFAAALRRRRIPFWLVASVVAIITWIAIFSWWAPGPAGAIVIAVIILSVVVSRRAKATAADLAAAGAPAMPTMPPLDTLPLETLPLGTPPLGTSPLDVDQPLDPRSIDADADAPVPPPVYTVPYLPETRAWMAESRARRRRAAPVRWATLGALVVGLGVVAIIDALNRVAVPVYFWVGGAIVIAGLIAGLIARRPAWSLIVLLVPALIGTIALGATQASLHDGTGRHVYTPTNAAAIEGNYRLAFGQLVLDLRSVSPLDSARTVNITIASGQVQLKLPPALNASVHSKVHLGDVRIVAAGQKGDGPDAQGGSNITSDVPAPAAATGAPLTINVHVADGDVEIQRS
jgi:phage shock protein PspC (stress-responsive transcriptional regulator)